MKYKLSLDEQVIYKDDYFGEDLINPLPISKVVLKELGVELQPLYFYYYGIPTNEHKKRFNYIEKNINNS